MLYGGGIRNVRGSPNSVHMHLLQRADKAGAASVLVKPTLDASPAKANVVGGQGALLASNPS